MVAPGTLISAFLDFVRQFPGCRTPAGMPSTPTVNSLAAPQLAQAYFQSVVSLIDPGIWCCGPPTTGAGCRRVGAFPFATTTSTSQARGVMFSDGECGWPALGARSRILAATSTASHDELSHNKIRSGGSLRTRPIRTAAAEYVRHARSGVAASVHNSHRNSDLGVRCS